MGRLSASDKGWFENRLHDQRPEVASTAREIYNFHFPYAEHNTRKKQLTINTLVFKLHTMVFNEFGDEFPVNRRFTADRVSHMLTMIDFDVGGAERSMELDGGKMSTLLRWVIHSLEIFMWTEDYGLEPEVCPMPDSDDWDDEHEEDFLVENATQQHRKLFLMETIWRTARRNYT